MSPVDRQQYPDNWEAIATDVKDAAGWTCQSCGRVCRRTPVESWDEFFARVRLVTTKPTQHILTVAHLNPDPMDCRLENLQAMCSVCHLRYDHQQRKKLGRKRLNPVSS